MIISKIPIFITARGNNEEIIQINKESLKFSYLFIKNLDLFNQTYIISDNNNMLDYAAALGFKKENNIYYPWGNEKYRRGIYLSPRDPTRIRIRSLM